MASITDWFSTIVSGSTDTRVRATWRVLLAWPVLWVLTGAVLAANVQVLVESIPAGPQRGGGLAQSVLHALFFVLILAIWARYLDRRSLSAYGVALTPTWLREFLLGVGAVLVGFLLWAALKVGIGASTVEFAPSIPEGSILWGLLVPAVALVLHAAVQQIVFFRVILETAAEGLHRRGLGLALAGLCAIPVAVLFFILMHEVSTPIRTLDLAIAGIVFSLLYLHTGSVALGIGAHFGALYGGILMSAVFEISGSPAGILGTIDQFGFHLMVLAYLVVAGWIIRNRGTLAIEERIANPRRI